MNDEAQGLVTYEEGEETQFEDDRSVARADMLEQLGEADSAFIVCEKDGSMYARAFGADGNTLPQSVAFSAAGYLGSWRGEVTAEEPETAPVI